MPDIDAAQSLFPRDTRRDTCLGHSVPPLLPGLSHVTAFPCPTYLIDVGDYGLQPLHSTALGDTPLGGDSYDPLPARGTPCYAHAHGRSRPCSRDGYRCPLEEAVLSRRPVQMQHVHGLPHKEPRLQNVLVVPLIDVEGKVTQVLFCCWDLSDAEVRAWTAARDAAYESGAASVRDLDLVAGNVSALSSRCGHDLSDRESDILALIAKGLTNRAISRHLQISVSTVKYHLGNLCGKLDAGGRHELIALAVRHELV